jgi:Ca2+/H+ antiporter, TMEM165/GDT1 family
VIHINPKFHGIRDFFAVLKQSADHELRSSLIMARGERQAKWNCDKRINRLFGISTALSKRLMEIRHSRQLEATRIVAIHNIDETIWDAVIDRAHQEANPGLTIHIRKEIEVRIESDSKLARSAASPYDFGDVQEITHPFSKLSVEAKSCSVRKRQLRFKPNRDFSGIDEVDGIKDSGVSRSPHQSLKKTSCCEENPCDYSRCAHCLENRSQPTLSQGFPISDTLNSCISNSLMINYPLFASTFALIFVAELPDKTAFATLLLATRGNPWAIFIGVAVAFLIQTIFAVVFGSFFTHLPPQWIHLAAGILFLVFAVMMWRRKEDEEEVEGGAINSKSKGELIGFGKTVWTSFILIFIAEWGDLTQLASASLVARTGQPLTIFVAAVLSLWTVTALVIVGGNRAAKVINPALLQKIAAVAFVGVGIYFIATALRLR